MRFACFLASQLSDFPSGNHCKFQSVIRRLAASACPNPANANKIRIAKRTVLMNDANEFPVYAFMALVTCPECSKQVSSAAKQCPSCGYPLSAQSKSPTEPLPTSVSVQESKAPVNAPVETHVVVHVAPKEWRGLAKMGWLLLGSACALALVPFLGFASWLIVFPVLLVTVILAKIIISRGGTGQGILLILTCIFIVPPFVFCAPFLSSLFGLAGIGAADRQKELKSAAQKQRHASLPTPFFSATPSVLARVVPTENKVAPSGRRYSTLIVGSWLDKRILTFLPNGKTTVQKFEGDTSDHTDRSWQIDGDTLTFATPYGTTVDTIVSMDESEFVVRTASGGRETFRRVSPVAQRTYSNSVSQAPPSGTNALQEVDAYEHDQIASPQSRQESSRVRRFCKTLCAG